MQLGLLPSHAEDMMQLPLLLPWMLHQSSLYAAMGACIPVIQTVSKRLRTVIIVERCVVRRFGQLQRRPVLSVLDAVVLLQARNATAMIGTGSNAAQASESLSEDRANLCAAVILFVVESATSTYQGTRRGTVKVAIKVKLNRR